MLNKLIWKSAFQSKKKLHQMSQKILSYKSLLKIKVKGSFLSFIIKKIHFNKINNFNKIVTIDKIKYCLIPKNKIKYYEKENAINVMVETRPAYFLLIKQKNAIRKITQLLNNGFIFKSSNKESYNILHDVMYLYANKLISFERSKQLLDIFLSNKVSLLSETSMSINVYKKSVLNLIKNTNVVKNKTSIEKVLMLCDKKMYDYIINHQNVLKKDKALLDYMYLKGNLNNMSYYSYELDMYETKVFKKEIESIINRGYIYQDQNSIFNSLKLLFSKHYIEELISSRALHRCYEEFGKLKTIGKKALTTQLINNNNETTIFNLLSYGLNLNWSIKNQEGKENIVALEILNSIPMIKAILSSELFNICISNTRGENILHLIGGLAISSPMINELLTNKIKELSSDKQQYLLNQVSIRGLTPLSKAVYLKDDVVIDYLLKMGVVPYDEIKGLSKDSNCALSFIDNMLLPTTRQEKSIYWIKIDNSDDNFWQNLSQKWNAEKMNKKLSLILKINKDLGNKTIKI